MNTGKTLFAQVMEHGAMEDFWPHHRAPQRAPFRSTKAAVKLHTLLDLSGAIPAFIHVSDGKLGDVNVFDILPIEAGAFYIMDRGYLDFARLFKLHQSGAFFVTRAKRGMNARRVYSTTTGRTTGVICDQRIALNGFYVRKDYPNICVGRNSKTRSREKTLVFLTNNMTLPPWDIAAVNGCQKARKYGGAKKAGMKIAVP